MFLALAVCFLSSCGWVSCGVEHVTDAHIAANVVKFLGNKYRFIYLKFLLTVRNLLDVLFAKVGLRRSFSCSLLLCNVHEAYDFLG